MRPRRHKSHLRRPHGLTAGQGVTCGGEMRFVTGVLSETTVAVNAPFSVPPADGGVCGPTVTYPLATDLMGTSIYDYWDPTEAVQRILSGAAMDVMKVKVNGDSMSLNSPDLRRTSSIVRRSKRAKAS